MKLRSSIKPQILHTALIQGTILATMGMAILIFSGVFLPPEQLKFLGPFAILIALLLITLGLYPFQQLKKLETSPHEILFSSENHFLFSWKRKPLFIVSLETIEHLSYLCSGNQYGIAIVLKREGQRGITVCDPNFDLTKFQSSSQKKYECDLFLPFFTRRSFEELERYQKDLSF